MAGDTTKDQPAPEPASSTDVDEATVDPGDEGSINIRDLIVSLDPEISGKFEPISGILMVNVTQAEFMAGFNRFAAGTSSPEDIDQIRTINHETYHGIQAAASGYSFDRQRRQFTVMNQAPEPPNLANDPETQAVIADLYKEAGDDPELKLRAQHAEAIILTQRAVEFMDANAAPNDNSFFGALHPAFFRFQDEITAHEAVHNADGLSILGVLEGSAVAWAHHIMHPRGNGESFMLEEFATVEPVYRELYDATQKRVGARAFELLLPATALALCYAEPHNAYLPLLDLLAGSETGAAMPLVRSIAQKLPAVAAAGAILRTASDVRRTDDSYIIYDTFIKAMESGRWTVDMIDLLADPTAIDKINSMPFALVTNDEMQAIKGSMTLDELYARILIMALVLKKTSRRPAELELRELQGQWAGDVLRRLADNLPPAASEIAAEPA